MTLSAGRLATTMLGGGQLEKLTIRYDLLRLNDLQGAIVALFNPSQLAYTQQVTWRSKQTAAIDSDTALVEQHWSGSSPTTLRLDLLFDTYTMSDSGLAGVLAGAGLPAPGAAPARVASVRAYTDELARLAGPNPALRRPPTCSLTWGSDEIFWGVLASLSSTFTMFMPDGTPVRATAQCTFTEGASLARPSGGASAAAVRTRTVRRGDTLQKIAAEEYGDPARWRVVASANGIANPRALVPGTLLKLPRLP